MTVNSDAIHRQLQTIGGEAVVHLSDAERAQYYELLKSQDYIAIKALILARIGLEAKMFVMTWEPFHREWFKFRPWAYRRAVIRSNEPVAELAGVYERLHNTMARHGLCEL